MNEQGSRRRTAMVIAAPLSDIKRRIKETVKGVLAHKTGGGFKCELYVVVTDCPEAKADKTKASLEALVEKHWQDKCRILTPPPLKDLSTLDERKQVHELAGYLVDPLIKRLIRQGEKPRNVGLIWNPGWTTWTAAGSAVSAAIEGVSWWEPPGAPWTRLLPGHRILDGLRLPLGEGEDENEPILGESALIEEARRLIRLFAPLPYPVLIIGETGTGKELCARRLHELGKREGILSSLNGALLDPNLAASTLFGHKKGAFTGADADRKGRFVEAKDGTFFLDELSSVPLEVQSMLLRALQDAEDGKIHLEQVGGRSDTINVRFVSALQRDPLMTGELRSDLYYRIAGLILELPPLRDRGEDVLLLADRFLKEMTERHGEGPGLLDGKVRELFLGYSWPGNIRELRVTIRQAWLQKVLTNNHALSAIGIC